MLLRRACMLKIGGFDPVFGSYGEDADLCRRAQQAGWQVGTVRGVGVETLGTADPGRREVLGTAAIVLLRFKERGIRGAARGAAGGLRKALAASRGGEWRRALRILSGTVIGMSRVAGQLSASADAPAVVMQPERAQR